MTSRMDTALSISLDPGFQSILHWLERRALDNGSAPSLRFFHDQPAAIPSSDVDAWSWRELRDRARGVAAVLAATPAARPGARVLLVYPAGLGFMAAFHGCLYAGVVPVPVPPPRRAEGLDRWLHVAEDAGISGVLTSSDLAVVMEPLLAGLGGEAFCLAPADADPAQAPSLAGADLPMPSPAPSDLAFLQYTSGSTSEPKGVMITHATMMANLRQIALGYELTATDHMASWLPHYHDLGLVGTILSSVYAGFSVAMMAPAAFLRRPLRWLEMASHVQATLLGGPNFAYDHCTRRATPEAVARLDLRALRLAYTGAETIRPRTLARFHAAFAPAGFRHETFYCCYGMAEATLFITGNRPAEPPYLLSVKRDALTLEARAAEPRPGAASDNDPSRLTLAGCGRAVDGLDIAIADPEAFVRLPDGAVGEIWARGPNISAGYWRRPEQNAGVFDLALGGDTGWFRTGDLGFLHEGQLYVTGRLKDLIIIRGENHYPQDIEETAVASHPALTAAGAFAMEVGAEETGDVEGLGIVCELSRAAMRGLDADAVIAAVRGAISRHHDLQLSVAVLIRPGHLPRTPSGKVQRFACRKGVDEGTLPLVARWDAHASDASPMREGRAILLDALRKAPRARREDMLRRRLQEEVARLARLPAGQLPSADAGFFDLGLDSVAAVDFAAMLERELLIQAQPTLMFEHPNLAALSAHLAAALFTEAPAPAAKPPAEPETQARTGPLAPALADEMARLRQLLANDRSPASPHGHVTPARKEGTR